MNYTNLKKQLKKQIESNIRVLWTWDEKENSFTCVYKSYCDDLRIYTPQQLLDKLNETNEVVQ